MERLPLPLRALVLLRCCLGVAGWGLEESRPGVNASPCPEGQLHRQDGPGEWSPCRPVVGAYLPPTAAAAAAAPAAGSPSWLPDGAREANASDSNDAAHWGYQLFVYLSPVPFLACCCCALAARSRPFRRPRREWFRLRAASPEVVRRRPHRPHRPQNYGAIISPVWSPASGQGSDAAEPTTPLLASVPDQEAALPPAGARGDGTTASSETEDTPVDVEAGDPPPGVAP